MRPRRHGRGPTGACIAALLALALTACGGGQPDIRVGRAQADVPVAGASQIVVEITNEGDGGDELVGADTPSALGVELHLTEIVDGQALMTELESIEIRAGETVRFRPGELHLMLVVPDETVVLGGTFDLTLHFERSGDVTIEVEVVDVLDLTGDGS